MNENKLNTCQWKNCSKISLCYQNDVFPTLDSLTCLLLSLVEVTTIIPKINYNYKYKKEKKEKK